MALIHSFEKSGQNLFRYRGPLPAVLFIITIPVLFFDSKTHYSEFYMGFMTGLSIVFAVAGFIIRAYTIGTTPKGTSGRNTRQQVAEVLNKTGIYAMVRHPLYLGNYLIWGGIVLFTYNLWFFFTISLLFWIYYERIMFAEERFLERKFGEEYLQWSQSVPAFLPDCRKHLKSSTSFSLKTVLRREYSGFLAIVLSYTYIDYLRISFTEKEFPGIRLSLLFLAAATIITLILRTLKHHTNILHEENRS